MAESSVRPLPTEIENIDSDWLTAALRTRAPGVTVQDFAIVDILNGTGTKIRLRLNMDEKGVQAGIPKTVILKGGFESHSRDMHTMHENEVRAYRDVLSELYLPSPICYFADHDPEAQQGIIIMEDLVASGVSFCSALLPQGFDEVARRLSTLAHFHSRSYGSSELASGGKWDWLEDVNIKSRSYLDAFLQPEVWNYYVDLPRGAAVSRQFQDRGWMAHALDKNISLADGVPQAALHTDTHLGNLYVAADGTPGFFDMLPHRGPVMSEVSYHICCALDPADRRRWERPLIQHYLDELSQNGIAPLGFDQAMHQYAGFLARGYCIFLINASEFQLESINTAYTARYSAAMIDNDTVAVLDAIR